MTWQELYDALTPEQRQTDITIAVDDDVYGGTLDFAGPDDEVLDPNHPYLWVNL